MDRLKGSMETLSAMQITADMERLDVQSKTILHSREALVIILKETVAEYQACTWEEVMGFKEVDSITEEKKMTSGTN